MGNNNPPIKQRHEDQTTDDEVDRKIQDIFDEEK